MSILKKGVNMKKAQISFFVIMGILVLFAIGILFYFKGAITEIAEQMPLDIQPVVSHVDHCLDKTATDALELVGKQGGAIYESQGGLTIDLTNPDMYIDFQGYKVYMGIIPSLNEARGCEYPRSYYPYRNELCGGDEEWITIIGEKKLPELDSGAHSIKNQLESYINNNLKSCTDFSAFQNFVIEAGNVSSSVFIAGNDVAFFVYFPISITTQTTKGYVDEFTIKKDVRLRKVHNFTRDIINKDIADARYIKHGQSAEEGTITAKVYLNIESNHNLVWVEDSSSILKNEPYKFWFGVKNRKPVLGCIKNVYDGYSGDPLTEVVKPKPEQGWGVDDENMLTYEVTADGGVIQNCPNCDCSQGSIYLIAKATLTDEAGLQDCKEGIQVRCACCR